MVIIFWPTSDEEWRKLHNVELNDLYFSPNIVRVIKLRMRWVGHVARMGEWRRLHNEELYDLYSSPNIIEVIKNQEE